jgi:UDP-galactopyranose mutase
VKYESIVVYSHLRWGSVPPRPQQLLVRISQARRVLFFEETVPVASQDADSIELRYPLANLIVARPMLQGGAKRFDAERLAPIAKRLLRWQDFESHVAWLYTPLALPLARALSPEVIVYDRTVQPSAFDQAAPPLWQLQAADVVFARELLDRVS